MFCIFCINLIGAFCEIVLNFHNKLCIIAHFYMVLQEPYLLFTNIDVIQYLHEGSLRFTNKFKPDFVQHHFLNFRRHFQK